jgi:hypothetical protein
MMFSFDGVLFLDTKVSLQAIMLTILRLHFVRKMTIPLKK